MAHLSDDIEEFILELLSSGCQVELQRNLLAGQFSCSPSQINYVLATRFSPERGYHVESRRGGGGFVRVVRVNKSRAEVLQEVARELPPALSFAKAHGLLHTLYENKLLSLSQARLMLAATGESCIGKDESAAMLRARLFCTMLNCAAKEAEENVMQ